MSWPVAILMSITAIAVTTMFTCIAIYQPPESESPKSVCIKERGAWTDGYGRPGWSGACVFPKDGASGK